MARWYLTLVVLHSFIILIATSLYDNTSGTVPIKHGNFCNFYTCLGYGNYINV